MRDAGYVYRSARPEALLSMGRCGSVRKSVNASH
jgi:hypothetical protein